MQIITIPVEWKRDKDGEIQERDKERIQTVVYPKEGVISLPDFADLLGLSLGGLKQFILKNNLSYSKISRVWIIDFAVFWEEVKKL
ncbi:MAG: hypothetical protein KAX49_03810 [Halanaerobiales bacterium]|nr:hypothetical protein [Halanaerobiales bacterium]